jgi:hypothetical protein
VAIAIALSEALGKTEAFVRDCHQTRRNKPPATYVWKNPPVRASVINASLFPIMPVINLKEKLAV